jgi:arylsulfatase A-like enzyme
MRDRSDRGSGRLQVLLVALSLGPLLLSAGCRPAKRRPPNIILAMIDTLRADYLGAYGFEGAISPNLDRLASEAVVYENCIAQSPWTKPSVASMITSLYPQVHGLTNHEGKYWGDQSPGRRTGILPDQAQTLAEGLSAAGYVTGGFVSNPWVTRAYGFAQGFDHYDESGTVAWDRADRLIGAAREWIESLPEDRPFFVYLHFMDVHAPYGGPKSDYDALIDSASLGMGRRLRRAQAPDKLWRNIEHRPTWATDEMRLNEKYWRARYASGVRSMDRRLAELFEFLGESPTLEQSVVVVTSDHGEELFDNFGWSHGQNLYEHQLRVPLLIRRPGAEGGGSRVTGIVELLDLMPTLLELGGAEPVALAQGRALIATDAGANERVAFATATQRAPGLFAVRTARYKLHHDIETGQSQLFDLERDPGERNDVAESEPAIVETLLGRLQAHLSESLAGGTLDAESAEMPEDLQERLKALGYLN